MWGALKGALCAKGTAGLALLHDHERPQYPMIRTGPRGAGQWRRASWDEALEYVADKLKAYPPRARSAERGFRGAHQPQYPHQQDFHEGPRLPNHFTHDALCKGSVNTAFRSLTGYTDAQIGHRLRQYPAYNHVWP